MHKSFSCTLHTQTLTSSFYISRITLINHEYYTHNIHTYANPDNPCTSGADWFYKQLFNDFTAFKLKKHKGQNKSRNLTKASLQTLAGIFRPVIITPQDSPSILSGHGATTPDAGQNQLVSAKGGQRAQPLDIEHAHKHKNDKLVKSLKSRLEEIIKGESCCFPAQITPTRIIPE